MKKQHGTDKAVYLYDERVDQIYKVPLTRISRYKVHSIVELDYQQGHETNVRTAKEGTLITDGSSLISVNGNSFYAPDLKGFVKEKTSAIYYKTNAEGDLVSGETPEIKSITTYLQTKERTITKDGSTYAFYNYKNIENNADGKLDSIWANIKVESDGIETYWVWIPRYAYKMAENNKIDIVYIDVQDNIAGTTKKTTAEGYIVHPVFKNGKKGIWASKYEAEQIVEGAASDYPYYLPDMKGFNKETTYIEIYKEDKTFEDVPLKSIDNLAEFAEKNRWFDYEKQIWANIKVVSNEIETWWVWIPRYAYSLTGQETRIIFVDTTDTPLEGGELPSNYIVHPAFKNGKKGIWVSKYEVQQDVRNKPVTNNVNMPDMSGFDPNTTWIEVYNDDGTFTETKLADISNISQFAAANRWYDYSKQIWANVKVVNTQETESTSDDIETWWVWIPKYAYSITGDETTIMFLDESGNPRDGGTLPSNYIPHPAFKNRKGIWASKYEVDQEN